MRLAAGFIFLVGCWIYAPVLRGDWLWDDALYLTHNPLLHDPARGWKTWFSLGSLVNYFPITATVQWGQWASWQQDTLGYHITNVILQCLAACCLWRVLAQLHLKWAWLGGLLFVAHPMTVESVAWISELKNTLSILPFLLALSCFIEFERTSDRRFYLGALGLFVVAMLCKTTMVAFPFVILLYLWWKRGQISRQDWLGTIPFFAVSVVLGGITMAAGSRYLELHHMHPPEVPIGGFASRLALAGLSLAFYFAAAVFPWRPLPMYPQWQVDPPSAEEYLPWLVLAGVIVLLWTYRATWGRPILFGLGFFVLNLLPFLGFVTTGNMNFTWVMDHFLYLPLIGIIGLAVAGVEHLYRRLPTAGRNLEVIGILLVLGIFIVESRAYAAQFINQPTLWAYTAKYDADAPTSVIAKAKTAMAQGDYAAAVQALQHALRINPTDAQVHTDLGLALMRLERTNEAIAEFQAALRLHSGAEEHANLSNALAQAGNLPAALDEIQESLALNSYVAGPHAALGNLLVQTGHLVPAIEQYQSAIRLGDDDAAVHLNLGLVLFQLNRIDEAADQFSDAIKLSPQNPVAHNDLGFARAKQGRVAEAISEYQAALTIDPTNALAQNNLARLQSAAPAPGVP